MKNQVEVRAGTIKRIHVNQHVIKRNRVTGETAPVVTVKMSKGNLYGHEVEIKGSSRVIYSPEKPMACGAVVWIETKSSVIVTMKDTKRPRKRRGAATVSGCTSAKCERAE